ncbi:MAG: hypothetical protein ABSG96_24335 [Terracidiphilus sp.]|jgi:hypothetical protein
MKNGKPKGKVPSLIGGTLGAPRKTVTDGTSKCKRCEEHIPKGTECYEIPQLGGSFSNYKRYCDQCFQSILERTKADLDALLAGYSQKES